ncbi:hypothetical protein RRG08_047390 [Elysia crispata]|uniref:Uncharacterized protein n=1 Tax=Elysia crispata TaxID=231223 RepID=A0AAE1CRJ6_9GAST|nr:hypothetical protein RRG08_047390 [Elysia crispata]
MLRRFCDIDHLLRSKRGDGSIKAYFQKSTTIFITHLFRPELDCEIFTSCRIPSGAEAGLKFDDGGCLVNTGLRSEWTQVGDAPKEVNKLGSRYYTQGLIRLDWFTSCLTVVLVTWIKGMAAPKKSHCCILTGLAALFFLFVCVQGSKDGFETSQTRAPTHASDKNRQVSNGMLPKTSTFKSQIGKSVLPVIHSEPKAKLLERLAVNRKQQSSINKSFHKILTLLIKNVNQLSSTTHKLPTETIELSRSSNDVREPKGNSKNVITFLSRSKRDSASLTPVTSEPTTTTNHSELLAILTNPYTETIQSAGTTETPQIIAAANETAAEAIHGADDDLTHDFYLLRAEVVGGACVVCGVVVLLINVIAAMLIERRRRNREKRKEILLWKPPAAKDACSNTLYTQGGTRMCSSDPQQNGGGLLCVVSPRSSRKAPLQLSPSQLMLYHQKELVQIN